MRYDWPFKIWAVLLCVCIVGVPLFAQIQDSAQQKKVQNIQPANPPAQQTPAVQQYPPAQQYAPPVQQTRVASGNRTFSKEGNSDEYLTGKMEGKLEAKGKPVWILAGLAGTGFCLCIGVAGIGLALIVPPSPPEQALLGKSSLFIQGYTEGYKSNGRWKNAGYATIGCAIAAVINLVINLAMGYDPTKGISQ